MQTDNRLFDDLAKVANGALHTMSGMRDEIENRMRERVERWLGDMDMVPREEFDAIKAVAQTARTEQEALAVRVEALEKRIAVLEGLGTAEKPARAKRSTNAAKSGAKTKRAPARKPAAKQKTAD
ncbi:MAG: accessory factor UbiK family protein [Geminicoccaceae bacterium]